MMLIVVLAMLAAAPVLSLPSGDLPGTGSTSDLVPLNQPGEVSARSMRASADRGTRKAATEVQTSFTSARATKAKSSGKSASVANPKLAVEDDSARSTSRSADKKSSRGIDSALGEDSLGKAGKLVVSVGQLVSTFVRGLSDVLSSETDFDESLVTNVVQSLSGKQSDDSAKKDSSRGAKTDGDSQRGLVSSVTDTVGGLVDGDLDKTLEKLLKLLSGLSNSKSRSGEEEDDWIKSSEVPEAKSAGKSKGTR